MNDYNMLHFNFPIPDSGFPIMAFRQYAQTEGPFIPLHWIEQIDIKCVRAGRILAHCGNLSFEAGTGDIIVVNNNELFSAESLTEESAIDTIVIDFSLLEGPFTDNCQAKYITQISSNLIMFKNRVGSDSMAESYFYDAFNEYHQQESYYELAIKGAVFKLLAHLLRNYVNKTLTQKEFDTKVKNLKRFDKVLKYISENYSDQITVDQLAEMACMSSFYFCRMFKQITGRTLSDYINHVRIAKAETLLYNTDMNISEIASVTGFNNLCYFSKLFKEYKKISPSALRSKVQKNIPAGIPPDTAEKTVP